MSRIGRKPIILPAGVEVLIDGQSVHVKGPKGELKHQAHPTVSVALVSGDSGEQILETSVVHPEKPDERAQWGTARAILANLVKGVSQGFSRVLEVNGVGYRVNLSGRDLVLTVGYSHEVRYSLPEGIEASIADNTITLSGIDAHLLGQVASEIRKIRPPEPYKGKGIKYSDEIIRRKAGKAAKASQ